jgi:hypothetical protein
MNEYILLMHGDAKDRAPAEDGVKWGEYIAMLRRSGQFDGGSSMGTGERMKKGEAITSASTGLTGYIRLRAASLEEARRFLIGNPVYEAGGTVEIRELPHE